MKYVDPARVELAERGFRGLPRAHRAHVSAIARGGFSHGEASRPGSRGVLPAVTHLGHDPFNL